MNRVCAVLVNYKGAADIAAAAASVLADSPNVELVVVDNSEDPEEACYLRSLLPPTVRLLVAPANLGFGAGCNLAVASTDANLIWLVNPDVRVLPGCLDALTQALHADELLAAVAPRQYLDMSRRWLLPPSWLPTAMNSWVRERASRAGLARARFVRATRAEALRLWTAPVGATLAQRALSGAAMLVRRSCLQGELLFDPRFFMYFEDSDFCLRMRAKGMRLAAVPGATVVHQWQMAPHKDGLMAEAAPVYFEHHFAGDRWLYKAGQVAQGLAFWPDFACVQWGASVPVPSAWASGWVLELSPTPLIAPAVGFLGVGGLCPWPGDALAVFQGALVYGRLGPLNDGGPESDCLLLEFRSSKQRDNWVP